MPEPNLVTQSPQDVLAYYQAHDWTILHILSSSGKQMEYGVTVFPPRRCGEDFPIDTLTRNYFTDPTTADAWLADRLVHRYPVDADLDTILGVDREIQLQDAIDQNVEMLFNITTPAGAVLWVQCEGDSGILLVDEPTHRDDPARAKTDVIAARYIFAVPAQDKVEPRTQLEACLAAQGLKLDAKEGYLLLRVNARQQVQTVVIFDDGHVVETIDCSNLLLSHIHMPVILIDDKGDAYD